MTNLNIDYKIVKRQMKFDKLERYQQKLDKISEVTEMTEVTEAVNKTIITSNINNISASFRLNNTINSNLYDNISIINHENMTLGDIVFKSNNKMQLTAKKTKEKYYLGQLYKDGKEQINLEFKEFCLKRQPDTFMTNNQIQTVILTGEWNNYMSKLVEMSIDEYFDFVVPKYIACYSNSYINGKLVIGVDDYGEITGIPSKYGFNKFYFKKKLMKSLKNQVYTEQKKTINEIMENIHIKIIKLESKAILLDDEIKEHYDAYMNLKNDFDKKMDSFINERNNWHKLIEPYTGKLIDLANDTKYRFEVVNFIIEKKQDYKKTQQHNINLLQSSEYIHVPSGEEIVPFKENENCVVYWIIKYKDEMISSLSTIKPKKPLMLNCYGLSQMLSKLSHMRKRFIEKSDINYYIIEIDIFGNKLKPEIYYKSCDNDNKWKFRCRTLNSFGEPSCY